MGFFSTLHRRQSSFYQYMWQELSEIKIIDTHEHLVNNEKIMKNAGIIPHNSWHFPVNRLFETFYIHSLPFGNDYNSIAQALLKYRGTGYLKAWMIAIEDIYGLVGPITGKFVEQVEKLITHTYAPDFERNTYLHYQNILQKMGVERIINNIDIDAHLLMPQPLFQASAGLNSILEGWRKDHRIHPNKSPIYTFISKTLNENLEDLQNFEDYCSYVCQFLNYLKSSNHYRSVKIHIAYNRPLFFAFREDNHKKLSRIYLEGAQNPKDQTEFEDYMMHFILNWAKDHWKIPFQIHTGLGYMYFSGSDAINLSNLFIQYPEINFDLFHGNYPYRTLPGMLHQISNISANLCWLPTVSASAAQQTLTEIFEMGDMVMNLSCHQPSLRTSLFGGDAWLIEGAYGALQITKDVLIRTLEDLLKRGHIYRTDAVELAIQVLYENPKRIYRL